MIRIVTAPRRVFVAGTCAACGLAFAGPHRRRRVVAAVLRVHEEICPGGDRTGEVTFPLGR